MKRIFSALTPVLLGLSLAAPELSPQGIIVNPVPTDLSVRTWVDKDPNKSGNPVYQVGEPIRISVQVNQDAYVYLFSVKSNGLIDPILPNNFDRDNLVRANQVRTFPPNGASYRFNVDRPEGQDRVLAVASRQPLSMDQVIDIQSGTSRVQGADNLARALSIVVTPIPQQDWASNVAFFTVGRAQPTPPPPTTGTLSINSNPQGAQVLVNGRAVGNAPLSVSLQPGRYDVELRLGGYETFRSSVVVNAGQNTPLNANLAAIARTGDLIVSSTPDRADVFVNGQRVGVTPLRLNLNEGSYEVRVVEDGYSEYRATVQVRRGEATRVEARLQPQKATLEIFTNVDARIFVDGVEVGQTRNGSLRVEIDAGRNDRIQIVALAPGYRVEVEETRVTAGRTERVRLNLTRAK